jgi:hypothetical protein
MAEPIDLQYDYNHVPTLREFSNDNSFIRAALGPIGSGKSSACVMELLQRAKQQKYEGHGRRKTKWLAARSTYRQLEDTTIETFFHWCPPAPPYRTYNKEAHNYRITGKLPDGTLLETEILFRSLDQPDSIKNLESLDITGAWLNEARDFPKSIFDMVMGRLGRYPHPSMGGPSWHGMILDTNPPDIDHWFYKFFEEDRLTDPKLIGKVSIYHQPSGMADDAENLINLPPFKANCHEYYSNQMMGKSPEWIKVYVHGEYGYSLEGKPVYANFVDSIHVPNKPIEPIKGIPLVLGIDAGMTPACVICQITPQGGFNVIQEFVTTDSYCEELMSQVIKPALFSKYMGYPISIVTDITKRSEADSKTTHDIIKKVLKIIPKNTPTNAPTARIESVDKWLRKFIQGKAAFQLSPSCSVLRKGFNGKYQYRRVALVGRDKYIDTPEKSHPISDIHDALQYACLYSDHGIDIANREYKEKYHQTQPRIPSGAWT